MTFALKKSSCHFAARDGIEILGCFLPLIGFVLLYFSHDPGLVSLVSQIAIGTIGALAVYLMLRMDLVCFAVPAFMGIGGFSAAIAASRLGVLDVSYLVLISFLIPALIALPIGIFILRMRGIYFVLVTFLLAEIFPIVVFETPKLTGGSDGISGLPVISLLGFQFANNVEIAVLCCGLLLLTSILVAVFTIRFRPHLDSIEQNDALALSLGLSIWRFKLAGFCLSAGIAGLGGMAVVNMLLTAHSSSFEALSSVDYVVYAIVGGRTAMLGSFFGAGLLVTLRNLFSFEGSFSEGLFGLILIVIMLVGRQGLLGAAQTVVSLSKRMLEPSRGVR